MSNQIFTGQFLESRGEVINRQAQDLGHGLPRPEADAVSVTHRAEEHVCDFGGCVELLEKPVGNDTKVNSAIRSSG
jgi:hypothetical protein